MSLARSNELQGAKPVPLTVRVPPGKRRAPDWLATSLRDLYMHGELADVSLVCAESKYMAHKVVLASASEVFRAGMAARTTSVEGSSTEEVRLSDIENPEAVKLMLDYIYLTDDDDESQVYNPRTQEVNKDVLRLSRNFGLEGLAQRATHWLAKGLSTANVVERLTVCDEFSLAELRERILEQLALNKKALVEVANSPQIMKYPKLMQALLQQAAAASMGAAADPAPASAPAPAAALPAAAPAEPPPATAPISTGGAKKKARKA